MGVYSARPGTTGRKIYEAAVDLFFEKGYQATSLRELADRVGIQGASLYNHLDSKEALLFEIMHGISKELVRDTMAALEGVEAPEARVRVFMSVSIRFHAERQREMFVGNSELRSLSLERRRAVVAVRDEYENILRDSLRSWQEWAKVDLPDIALAGIAGIAIATSVGTWFRNEGRLTLEEVVAALCAMYLPCSPLAGGALREREIALAPAGSKPSRR